METTKVPATQAIHASKPRDDSDRISASDSPVLSVVICTLDEHEAIRGVLSELGEHLQGIQHEVIVVDDSTDERTAVVVNDYAREAPQVRLIRRHNASGLSSAAINGWDAARGRFLAIMDGDGQHDPALMKALLRKLDDPAIDVAVASRYLEDSRSGLHGLRHRLSRAGIWLTDSMLGVPLADPLSGCFAMRREWYEEVRGRLSGLGFKILIDVIASAKRHPRTAQIPTLLRARAGGASKLDARVVIDLLTLLIEKRTRGSLTAKAMMNGLAVLSTLCMQLLSLALLLKFACPLWAALFLSVGFGLTGRWGLTYLLTSRSLRPHTLREFRRQWSAFYVSRWSDLLLNACVAIALCTVLRFAWPLAALAGVLLAEARYHIGNSARTGA
ncbi:glycosyltransferase [Dyella psychrodurans]|uniref:glycosyltransferase n=1 Tax=Dyella psychrodurans TaxID=1927960 RepID=UPI0013149601|nr:glycosyltransferase [Dyella psychrodurans]